ncbi:MutS-related protein [Flammeovirga aprica]|uniref:DNA mismatch repair proteins mutS family domain-containing protein n=1 Tax=Flammeovirga aprica JL-4 TaxID=694437 RepID=A0A7X9XDC1_9BACT|nr:hypothetical protein [Flammeovirga aprica]NME72643.1 hypothetical protein [Flammeovirga aprica JL-4]
MQIDQLQLKEEIIPLYDDKQNYKVSSYIEAFILNSCTKEELAIRQKVFQCLLSNREAVLNYNYNKLYYSEALQVVEDLKKNDFIEDKKFLFYSKKKVKNSKISRLTASLIFFTELKKCIKVLIEIADVNTLSDWLEEVNESLQQFPDYSTFKNTSKELLHYLDALQYINFDKFWDTLFQLECYLSIAKCSLKLDFKLPLIHKGTIELSQAYFPLINKPVKYDITFDKSLNILNGPNMGGKSTFLKTISLCCYLGNRGVPIPASEAKVPFFETFNINFNTSDNHKNGTSHFMNEILSVKEFISSNNESKSVFGVFDELFLEFDS